MLAAVLLPWAAWAQPAAGKTYRLGILSPGAAPDPSVPTLANTLPAALRELGYVEGRNLVVERRFADDKVERLPALARELVALKCDVIAGLSTQGILAAREATTTIPIVMVIATDPVAMGLVASLGRPGGHITGISMVAETSLAGKRLELLKEAVPKAARVVVFGSAPLASSAQLKEARKAADTLRVKIVPVELRDADYDRAFATMAAEHADAIVVLGGPTIIRDRKEVVEHAAKHRLPIISSNPELTEVGALMSYGSSNAHLAGRAAVYVDKILKGAKPAGLPVEQASTFELVINLNTAKALNLTLPQSLLERADRVIR